MDKLNIKVSKKEKPEVGGGVIESDGFMDQLIKEEKEGSGNLSTDGN